MESDFGLNGNMKRFWEKVNKNAPNGCWEWTGGLRGESGYGAFKWRGAVIDAHYMSYLFAHKMVEDGMIILHKCSNKLCVNPDHLEPGTHSENLYQAYERGERQVKKKN